MIVIKIKTWKDYKQQFIDWIKEPRQNQCIEYANYMEQEAKRELNDRLTKVCSDYGFNDGTIAQLLVNASHDAVEYALESTIKLIKTCQPKI